MAELIWLNDRVKLEDVREWIQSSVVNVKDVAGPKEIFRANDWGITARFRLFYEQGKEDIVCKIGFLPIFKSSPVIYKLLSESCPDNVPELLDWKYDKEQTWMLFTMFKGELVRDTKTMDSIVNTAKALAEIQVSVSEEIKTKEFDIPTIGIEKIPDLYRSILNDIKDKYIAVWKRESVSLSEQFNLPLEEVKELTDLPLIESYLPLIEEWSEGLSYREYPNSIYHIDLHTNNAISQFDGNILIFDWEEATISHPFFSLEKLLGDARQFDEVGSTRIKSTTGLSYTPSELVIREAYLKEIPWYTFDERQRDFDIARCLAPIQYIYLSTYFLNQSGWVKEAPSLIAFDMLKTLKRWKEMPI
ncbi:phosphotransferase [Halobacillus seohaensis]|uniref:Phosphotransferase n=1 Tax=Halobacillus seohaensis TaxID=447421 RepID=A0ABW2ENX0_9BACI